MGTNSNNGARGQRAVGKRIRLTRKAMALTGPQFAALLRITANHLYVLERGERPVGARTMNRLAARTGRSLAWFMSGRNGA